MIGALRYLELNELLKHSFIKDCHHRGSPMQDPQNPVEHTPTTEAPREKRTRPIQPTQWKLFTLLVIAMICSVALWSGQDSTVGGNFWRSGAYFILIPGSMAAAIALLPWSKNSTGFGAFRASTISVLATAIVIREGFICVLMVLPLVLPVLAIVVYSVRRADRKRMFLIPFLLAGVSGEGIVYELPSTVAVQETRILDADGDAVLAAFAAPGELPEIKPLLFKLPFPKPTAFTGGGNRLGDTHTVQFSDMGVLDLEITKATPTSLTWSVTQDTTPIADWMTIHELTARWVETDAGLEFTMTVEFDRALAPAFYFDPLQRWGVGEMAEVLTDMLATNLAHNDGT